MARQTANYLQASGRDWEKARAAALIRDEYQCQAQRFGLSKEPCCAPKRKLVVHHIKWRIHGGTHDLDNLITLCHEHHAVIHPHLRFQLKEGEPKARLLGEWENPVIGDEYGIEL